MPFFFLFCLFFHVILQVIHQANKQQYSGTQCIQSSFNVMLLLLKGVRNEINRLGKHDEGSSPHLAGTQL